MTISKKTTIQISEETWRDLVELKELGESFDDFIKKILIIYKKK